MTDTKEMRAAFEHLAAETNGCKCMDMRRSVSRPDSYMESGTDAAWMLFQAAWTRKPAEQVAGAEVEVDLCAFENAIRNLEWIEKGWYPSRDHDLDGSFVTANIGHAKKLATAVLPRLKAAYTDSIKRLFRTHPAPEPVSMPDDVAKDAARYQFLCGADVPRSSTRWPRWKLEYWDGFHGGWQPLVGAELDATIDAALAVERGWVK